MNALDKVLRGIGSLVTGNSAPRGRTPHTGGGKPQRRTRARFPKDQSGHWIMKFHRGRI